ncbi:MAG: 6-carboxytetrahydropterin synthase [Gemmatimonadaceae bacterium]|nr:6-carboxytetrahydropterin synthase [Gemmatimonadaceae bacterium]
MPIVTATRRLRFNAAHRIHNPALSDAENTRLFGKCNNPNWHGHNYALEVSVRGEIDPTTGYVMDLGHVRDIVEREVIEQTGPPESQHRSRRFTAGHQSHARRTSWWPCGTCLRRHVAPAQLSRLRLWETENNYVEYEGE